MHHCYNQSNHQDWNFSACDTISMLMVWELSFKIVVESPTPTCEVDILDDSMTEMAWSFLYGNVHLRVVETMASP